MEEPYISLTMEDILDKGEHHTCKFGYYSAKINWNDYQITVTNPMILFAISGT